MSAIEPRAGDRRDRRVAAVGCGTPDAEATVRRAHRARPRPRSARIQRIATLAVLLTDDAAIRRLNAQWRGIDKPTNVLSFPAAPRRRRRDA